jgi:hypothetical protein
MVLHYWHLAVPLAFAVLVVWGWRKARQATLLVLAVVLLAASGFLLHTLVLDESHLERDLNGRIETAAWIGVPALLGIAFGALAWRRGRSRQA